MQNKKANIKIAYLCYKDVGTYKSDYVNEDPLLFDFLTSKGLHVDYLIWTDEQINWDLYDFVLIKSIWDYIDQYDYFLKWLDNLRAKNIIILNPSNVVKWNSDKRYLREIEIAGLPVIEFDIIERGNDFKAEYFFERFSSDSLVLKPTIGGGSKNVILVNQSTVKSLKKSINSLLNQCSYIVQPFVTKVQEAGEWSLIYFGGSFSHAVLKQAKPGDFRVQHYLGGTIQKIEPPNELINLGYKYIEKFARGCLYARVDGVLTDSGFKLMELELIDPYLFLFTDMDAYKRYFNSLERIIKNYQ